MSSPDSAHALARPLHRLRNNPEITSDLLQVAKAVVAATTAWWLVVELFDSQLPFLAPWTALLTVYPTVYQSLFRGVQSTAASWLGVGLSFIIGYFLGVNLWTFALALLVGLLCGRIPGLRQEGTAVATTAIFVLASGFSDQQPMLVDRIIEVAIGAAVGIVVNALLIPPLQDRQAARYVDAVNRKMGAVLVNMADEFSGSWETEKAEIWHNRTQEMSEDLSTAWQAVSTAQESRRFNIRRHFPGPRKRRRGGQLLSDDVGDEASYQQILERTDEGVVHLRHLARTLREATYAEGAWDHRFRERWADIVRNAGHDIANPSGNVHQYHDQLVELAENMSIDADLPAQSWPLYGSLISSMIHIVAIVGDVASTRQARDPASDNPSV